MAMTDEEILALPRKPANRAEVDAYYYADAFCTQLKDHIMPAMEKRSRMVPGCWRKLRAVNGLLIQWLRECGGTFEEEKKHQLKRMGSCLHTELKFNKQAVRDNEMLLVDMNELAILVVAATQSCKLKMCEPHECRSCQLGRVLDQLSFKSRENQAWWEVFGVLESEVTREHEP